MVSLAGSSDTTTGLLSGENISFLNSVFKSIVGPLSLIPNACLSLCFTPGPVFCKAEYVDSQRRLEGSRDTDSLPL